jgi:HD-GYP domain-containing protein (c-di-GMP phosphodiesterase class II)
MPRRGEDHAIHSRRVHSIKHNKGKPARDAMTTLSTTPRPRWRTAWSIRLQSLIAAVVVTSMLALASVLLWNSWLSARNALLDAASQNFSDLGNLVNEKSRRIVGPAQATLRQLSFDPLTRATRLEQRFERVVVLADILQHNPLLAAVYAGYPNGEFFLLRRLHTPELRQLFDAPGQAGWLVQSMTRAQSSRLVGQWHYLAPDLRPLRTQNLPDYQFDPRSRPWYDNALRTPGQQLTAPYIFYTSRQVGVTLSERSRDGLAVLGLDVDISDIGEEMASLRYTPDTQIAVVDEKQQVVAYPGTHAHLLHAGENISFKTLATMGIPALHNLANAAALPRRPYSYEAGGKRWYGMRMPLDAVPSSQLDILIAIPDHDLLGNLRSALQRQALQGLLIALLLLPLGWLAGRQIGRAIRRLSTHGEGLARFHFETTPPPAASHLKEVQELDRVLQHMGQTVQNFLGITETISREAQTEVMLEKVLDQLVEATRCTQGVVYLVGTDENELALTAVSRRRDGAADSAHNLPQQVPTATGLDWAGELQPADSLAIQLRSRQQELLGLLVLQFGADQRVAGDDFRAFAEKLSGVLEVSIETRRLIESQQRLLDGVIRLLADAIDAKSPYTGGHCERVPLLAEMFVDRLNSDPSSPYAGRWNAEQRYEFKLGAWLHDCGKITSPEHIIDKATKLETIYNRIHEIRTRFEVLHRDALIDYWQALAEGRGDADSLRRTLQQRHRQLQDDFAFVAGCNVGSEATDDADLERLQHVAAQTWLRHFDDRLGLSIEEIRRVRGQAQTALPVTETLLADRPEHVVPWGERRPPVERGDPANVWGFDMQLPASERNLGELHNLSVRSGTLTAEDRFRINDHIVQTLIMLRRLPWPRHLARVPDIAATHHEKLNGRGYPRRLGADQLTVEDRIIAIADVFEALTAPDRPYKQPKTLSESLDIMARMAREGHLCPEMFGIFLREGIWRDFAQRHLNPIQIDAVDIVALSERSHGR